MSCSPIQHCGCKSDSLVSCLEFEFGNLVNVCQKHEEKYCKQAQRLGFTLTKKEVLRT
ncbi:MAG: hypothetical protein OEL52_01005 [Nitrosopumilus sp.]|nr:hypothetical protein [Nitrosopumilus sp.]